MTWQPDFVPNDPEDLLRWLRDNVDELSDETTRPKPEYITLDILNVEPSKPQDGTIAYADGTNWNPGSGEGFYGRENGAWVKL